MTEQKVEDLNDNFYSFMGKLFGKTAYKTEKEVLDFAADKGWISKEKAVKATEETKTEEKPKTKKESKKKKKAD